MGRCIEINMQVCLRGSPYRMQFCEHAKNPKDVEAV